jgi:hypothetical protein
MTTATQPRLDAAQVAAFRREGFLAYRAPVLPAGEFTALAAHFDGLLAALPAGQRPEHMDVPHFADPALFRWLLSDAVLDLVEPLLGPDIALFSSHFICKPKGDGRRVPWHEDSAYWRGQMDPMEVVTVWLAIDPSTRENGCMRVIPGTHGGGYSEYEPVDAVANVFPTEIRKELFDAKRAVDLVLDPNQCSLHDGKLMHGSNANTSAQRRCGYTMRYISTRTRWRHEEFGAWHQLYLARGVDHAGNRYGDPTMVYDRMLAARSGAKVKTGH